MMRRALLLALVAATLAPATAVAVPPTVTYTLSGAAGNNGWYVGPVTVRWFVSADATDAPCPSAETLSNDTAGTTRSCRATNFDGTSTVETKVIKIDRTPPTAVPSFARPPDVPPFYTSPVALSWSGSDAMSGIASCSAVTYTGPDGPSIAPTGQCRDNAGNVTQAAATAFAYDATAPPLSGLTATPNADRTIALSWASSPDAQTATVVRNPGNAALANVTTHSAADGPLAPKTTYTYVVTVKDAAGNVTSATTSATTPAAPEEVASKSNAKGKADRTPTLRWKAQPRARYYNFQLFRDGKKLLSRWPTKNHYTLHAKWRFRGRTIHLTTGRYRWYVWPGYGRRSAHRYGRLHAKGAVAIPGRPPAG